MLLDPTLTAPKLKLDGLIESVPAAEVTVSAIVFEVTPLCAAVILLDPTPAPVASPAELIVTAAVFDELHVAELVRF